MSLLIDNKNNTLSLSSNTLFTIQGFLPTDGDGGSVTLIGRDGVGVNRSGGNVTLITGAATGTGTPGSVIISSADPTLPSELKFFEASANGTNYVGFKAAAVLAGNTIWRLPLTDGTSGQAIVTDGGGNLSFTTISGGGGNTNGFDLIDEFIFGNLALAQIGEHGWVSTATGAGFTLTSNSGDTNNPGQLSLTTGATAGNYIEVSQPSQTIKFDSAKRSNFIVKTGSSIASVKYMVGLTNQFALSSIAEQVVFVYDSSVDGFWHARTGTGALGTDVSTGVTVVLSTYYELDILQSTLGTYVFSINGTIVATISTNVPTGSSSTNFRYFVETITGAKSLHIDRFGFLSRDSNGFGGTTPGGTDTQVQFNDAGVFGGDSDFTWNKTTNTLEIAGVIRIANGSAALPSYSFTGDQDTGMYSSGANELSFALAGTQKVKIDATGITVFSGFFGPGATVAASPEFSFTNDPDTGMYRTGINSLGISAGGVNIATFAAAGVSAGAFTIPPGGKFIAPALGVPGAPNFTFTGDLDTGIFNFAPDAVGISGAGILAALFSPGGIFAGPTGSAASPSHSFVGDTNTGLYNSTADNLFVTTGGTQRFVWDSVGNVVTGTGALLTTATAGFLYIPTTPGTPTGVPTTYTGRSAIVLNTTGDALYGYDPVSAVWLNLTGSSTPGGANTQVQFNDSGTFGGDADLTWNKTTNTLTIVGSGTLAMQDATISRPHFKDYSEERTTPSGAGPTLTLDLENGNTFEVTLTGNITTVTVTNPPASGRAGSFTLIVHQDATGGRTISWASLFKFAGGTDPTLTATANAIDILTFVTTDAGTSWYGFTAGLNMS